MSRGHFTTTLHVAHIDGRYWSVLTPLVYRQDDVLYRVPPGFVTDFASIPRLAFWRRPSSKVNPAAVLHDAAYQRWLQCDPPRTLSRGDADRLFRDAMTAVGVGAWTRRVYYRSVRLMGWRRWRHARQLRRPAAGSD